MGLSCACYNDNDCWYFGPDDFSVLKTSRRKRCASCNKLIDIGAVCAEFRFERAPLSDIEEKIFCDFVPMASRYLCESCAEIYFNLDAIGYCYLWGDDLRGNLKEYHEVTGFKMSA